MNAKKRNTVIGALFLSATGAAVLAGCSGGSGTTDDSNGYTYNTYLSTSPSKWNVHNWETSDESYIQSFTEAGLYDVVMNSTHDGYKFISEMASEMPTSIDPADLDGDEYDSIKEKYYSGKEPSNGMIWDIPLRKTAKWEDGKAITAKDYVESMERLLKPQYANYRADSYYNGNFVIANAESYYKNGRQVLEPIYNYLIAGTDGDLYDESGNKLSSQGKYYIDLAQGESTYGNAIFSSSGSSDTVTFYTVLNNRSTPGSDALELAAKRITLGVSYYYWKFGNESEKADNKDKWDEIKKADSVSQTMLQSMKPFCIDEFDKKEVYTTSTRGSSDTDDRYTKAKLQADIKTVVSELSASTTWASKAWAWKIPLCEYVTHKKSNVSMDNVGVQAKDDYTLRLYLSKSISELDLKFQLSSNWLVNVSLYDSLTKKTSSSSWMTSYASASVENYKSYGPYKLTSFVADQAITIEKNDQWYGYSDDSYKAQFSEYTGDDTEQYKMTKIYTRIIKTHDTAVSEFMAGNLDDIDLNKDNMKTYGNSTRRTTTLESYTQKISFNTDRSKLASRQAETGKNKTVIANKNFRKGLSLGLDRNNFASQTTAGSQAFTGLLNSLYLANNVTGEMYRDTEQGKSVYNQIYGELGGKPTDATTSALAKDDNGYNYAWAKYYLKEGIKEEIKSTEDKHLQPGDTIDIEFRVYDNTSDTTKEMHSFISTAWSTLLKDAVDELNVEDASLLNGKGLSININLVKDEDYYTTARNGGSDMIFSIWGGAAIDPYGLMQVYLDKTFTNCCEYGFKGKQDQEELWIDLNGDGKKTSDEINTFDGWYHVMNDDLSEGEYSDDVKVSDADAASLSEEKKAQHNQWKTLHDKKLTILAGTEAGIVNRFEAIPIVARGSSSLTGFKVENATKNYINLVGYGGIRFLRFNYNNSEWKNFVSEYGGKLSDLYAGWRN